MKEGLRDRDKKMKEMEWLDDFYREVVEGIIKKDDKTMGQVDHEWRGFTLPR